MSTQLLPIATDKTSVVKTGSSWLTRWIVGAVALVVLTPLVLAAVGSLFVPTLVAVVVLVGLRLLWYWTSL